MGVIDAGIDDADFYALSGYGVVPGVVGVDLIGGIFEQRMDSAGFLEALEAWYFLQSVCVGYGQLNYDFVIQPAVVADDATAYVFGGLFERPSARLNGGFGKLPVEPWFFI